MPTPLYSPKPREHEAKEGHTIAITRRIPNAGLDLLMQADYRLRIYPKDQIMPANELPDFVAGASAILSQLTNRIDAKVLDAAGSQLKIVANYAIGFDNVDLPAAKLRNIAVTNTPSDAITDAVAEHTLALIMACGRRLVEADRFVRARKYRGWDPSILVGGEFEGWTLGLIGLGRIGKQVAERAKVGLHMNVMYHDVKRDEAFEQQTSAQYGSMEEVLAQSDYVSLHVPLLPSTRHLISAKELRLMKECAYLINTSRGPVVDESALVTALRAGRIAGAAIDVYEHEPKLTAGLTKLSNIIMTPHIASATVRARDDMAVIAAKNIIEVLSGRAPLNPAK